MNVLPPSMYVSGTRRGQKMELELPFLTCLEQPLLKSWRQAEVTSEAEPCPRVLRNSEKIEAVGLGHS